VTRGGEIGVKERSGQREEFQEQLKQAVVEQRDRMKRSIARPLQSQFDEEKMSALIFSKRNKSKESDCGRRRGGLNGFVRTGSRRWQRENRRDEHSK